jgi:hypothetical protein
MQVLTPPTRALTKPPKPTTGSIPTLFSPHFSDLKTIEGRGDDDPDGVIGEAEARADPAHNKYEESLMDMGEKVGKSIAEDTEVCVDLLSSPRETAPGLEAKCVWRKSLGLSSFSLGGPTSGRSLTSRDGRR